MDSNDIKSIWKKHTDEKIEKDKLSEDELNKMRSAKSQSIIRKIKNGIVFELTISALMIIIISYFLRMDLHIVMEISIVFLDIIFLFLLGVYIQYLRTVQKHEIDAINLKSNLEQLIEEIERILRFLFISSVILVPLGGMFGYIVGFFLGAGEDAVEVFRSTENLILFPVIILGITIIGFPLTKWYLKLLYGRHLAILKDTLQELMEEN